MVSRLKVEIVSRSLSTAIFDSQFALEYAQQDENPDNKDVWIEMLGYIERIQNNLKPLADTIRAKQLGKDTNVLVLPPAQHNVLRLWVLGGIDAIGKHSCKTVVSLMKKGYVDKDGPTEKGKNYVNFWEQKI